jgi:nucleotide-binding universal stress UspA family protein
MITLKRILVPHDFSEASEVAMKSAIELAGLFDAKLYVMHVSETAPETDIDVEIPRGLEERTGDTITGRLLKTVSGRDKRQFHPTFELRSGTPAAEIVRFARERDIDLIVMATHGRGLIAHALMGSVTETVVRKASCAVLTLPWWSFALAVDASRPSEVCSAPG